MKILLHNFKLIIALTMIFAVGYICSSSKDEKKEDTKKEDTKKEDTKKETTTSSEVKLYFCEDYDNGEIRKSDAFVIGPNGGYFTCMIDLRGTGKKIGVGKLELRISKLSDDGEKIMDTEKFDVQPDWDYIYFNKFHTFYTAGKYKVTAMKPDGTPVATGTVSISMR